MPRLKDICDNSVLLFQRTVCLKFLFENFEEKEGKVGYQSSVQ